MDPARPQRERGADRRLEILSLCVVLLLHALALRLYFVPAAGEAFVAERLNEELAITMGEVVEYAVVVGPEAERPLLAEPAPVPSGRSIRLVGR